MAKVIEESFLRKTPSILSKSASSNILSEEGPISINATDLKTNAANEEIFHGVFHSSGSIHYHKSLDFSNVGNYDNNQTGKAFRQFHQTRIYVKTANDLMYGHGKQNTKDNTYLISANLPEMVNYRIGSAWTNPLSGFGGPLMSVMTSLLKGGLGDSKYIPDSLYNRFQTVQVWNGSSPLNMSITIPVIDDGSYDNIKQIGQNTNFSEALEFLGALCLPAKVSRVGGKTVEEKFGFYTPPPSPIKLQVSWLKDDGSEKVLKINNSNYARIMIQLGGMLLIDNCIITSVNVNYTNTKALIRHSYSREQNAGSPLDYLTPIIASVTINFSTIEAITAGDYSKMLWLRHQDYMGAGDVDIAFYQRLLGGQKHAK